MTRPTCMPCKAPMRLAYTSLINNLYDHYRCDRCKYAQHVKRSARDPQTRSL